jgi:hypothetical protein
MFLVKKGAVRGPEKVEKHWYRDSRTTSANLADHQWSAEQNLGITDLESKRSLQQILL